MKLLHHERGLRDLSEPRQGLQEPGAARSGGPRPRARRRVEHRPHSGRHPVPQPGSPLLRGSAQHRRIANHRAHQGRARSRIRQVHRVAAGIGRRPAPHAPEHPENPVMEALLQSQVAFHLTGKRPAAGLERRRCARAAARAARAVPRSHRAALRLSAGAGRANGPARNACRRFPAIVDRLLQDIAQRRRRRAGDPARAASRAATPDAAGRRRRRIAVGAVGHGRGAPRARATTNCCATASAAPAAPSRSTARSSIAMPRCPADLLAHAWRVRAGGEGSAVPRHRRSSDRRSFPTSSARTSAARMRAGARKASRRRSAICDADLFDFGAMSRLLTKAAPESALPESRRTRIRALLSVLESQRFHFGNGNARRRRDRPYTFVLTPAAPRHSPRTASDWRS